MSCRHRGGCRRAQCRQQRHFRQQHRVAGRDFRQQAEGSYRLQPLRHVLRMAVYIFEAVDGPIRGRHQFDDAVMRMGGDPGRLVEQVPATKIRFDGVREFDEHRFDANVMHEPHHVLDTDEGDESSFRWERCGHSRILDKIISHRVPSGSID